MVGIRSFLLASRATSAIEFALVLPGMLLFMAGIVEMGRAYQSYNAVDRLATRYAIAWADCSDTPAGTCATELAFYNTTAATQNLVPQLTNAIALRMLEVQMSGTTASVIYASPANTTLTSAELTIAQSTIPSGQTGVVVTVNYTHTLLFFAPIMSSILGSSRAVSYTVAQLKS